MPFIRRNAEGVVESLHRHAEDGAEFLPDDHPEVRAFLGGPPAADGSQHGERFAELDADFVRVIEDVIDTLISKNVINITDLPSEAQTKLFGRKSFRERANRDALRLFGEGETD
ncbi:MAG TPA: hypothetical protein VF453_08050 [Burkholderiaceae bacterium]